MGQRNEHLAAQLEREIRDAARPLLVHFGASCSVCSGITESPLAEAARELARNVGLRSVNLDGHSDLEKRYGITEVSPWFFSTTGRWWPRFLGALPQSNPGPGCGVYWLTTRLSAPAKSVRSRRRWFFGFGRAGSGCPTF